MPSRAVTINHDITVLHVVTCRYKMLSVHFITYTSLHFATYLDISLHISVRFVTIRYTRYIHMLSRIVKFRYTSRIQLIYSVTYRDLSFNLDTCRHMLLHVVTHHYISIYFDAYRHKKNISISPVTCLCTWLNVVTYRYISLHFYTYISPFSLRLDTYRSTSTVRRAAMKFAEEL